MKLFVVLIVLTFISCTESFKEHPETSGSCGTVPETSGSYGTVPETSGSYGTVPQTSGSYGTVPETPESYREVAEKPADTSFVAQGTEFQRLHRAQKKRDLVDRHAIEKRRST
ncbi:uncharacterized protein LOC144773569 isoform X2 [Lissotriton helveticus]